MKVNVKEAVTVDNRPFFIYLTSKLAERLGGIKQKKSH